MLGLACFASVVGLTFVYGWWCDKTGGALWLVLGPPLIGIFSSLIIWLAYSGQWPIAMGYWGTVLWSAALAILAVISSLVDLANYVFCKIEEDWVS